MSSVNAIVSGNSTASEPVHVHLDNTLGVALIGLILIAIFFGVTLVQTLIFFQNSSQDPTYLKLMIVFLWSIDALQLALFSHYMYTVLITNFTKLLAALRIIWSWSTYVVASGTSLFLIRLYYARRIWILSNRNRFLTVTVIVLGIGTYILTLAYGVKLFSLKFVFEMQELSVGGEMIYDFATFSAQKARSKLLMYAGFGLGGLVDLWNALTLCYFLRKDKSGFGITDSIVDRLTIYIINTGLLTSFTAISCFVTFAIMPNNAIFIAIFSCLSKLYFNALLATLNTRKRLRDELTNKAPSLSGAVFQSSGIIGNGLRSIPRLFASGSLSAVVKKDKALAVTVNTETNTQMA
ncbi:hypothetical protein ACEPAF_4220 [Sanghuangporus sanghuang]